MITTNIFLISNCSELKYLVGMRGRGELKSHAQLLHPHPTVCLITIRVREVM
ncbi:MAG: hypothetical protein F6K14_14050 [Symploca sp. SIO2C1]|nr:hypothetical protein [Symploca sp. SIO2C1]